MAISLPSSVIPKARNDGVVAAVVAVVTEFAAVPGPAEPTVMAAAPASAITAAIPLLMVACIDFPMMSCRRVRPAGRFVYAEVVGAHELRPEPEALSS
ncbi:hypothetical protein [Nonomuraea antri]|uniref:hypothetical protein n=1 Tax=Nonomuraea antri TaxID=2730852 RepID=UPI001C2C479E|nr:hypothetical protein [Nonomuraea antri]